MIVRTWTPRVLLPCACLVTKYPLMSDIEWNVIMYIYIWQGCNRYSYHISTSTIKWTWFTILPVDRLKYWKSKQDSRWWFRDLTLSREKNRPSSTFHSSFIHLLVRILLTTPLISLRRSIWFCMSYRLYTTLKKIEPKLKSILFSRRHFQPPGAFGRFERVRFNFDIFGKYFIEIFKELSRSTNALSERDYSQSMKVVGSFYHSLHQMLIPYLNFPR